MSSDGHRGPQLERRVGSAFVNSSYQPRQKETVIVEPEEVELLFAAAEDVPEPKRPTIHVFPRTEEGVEEAVTAHGQTARETVLVVGHSALLPVAEAWERYARLQLAAGKVMALLVAPEGGDTDLFNAAFNRQLLAQNPEQ